jgi:hypothetical protein
MMTEEDESEGEGEALDLAQFFHSLDHDYFHDLLHRGAQKIFHYAHVVAHGCYFAAVYLEGHGFYSLCGGALFILLVWGLLGGFGDD